jgi:hypothetical protein
VGVEAAEAIAVRVSAVSPVGNYEILMPEVCAGTEAKSWRHQGFGKPAAEVMRGF